MAKPTTDSLSKKSDAINRQYAANFAGQSRHTRNLELLERLIDRQGKVLLKAKKLKGKPARELVDKVRERYLMYRKEHALIADAQTLGRADVEFADVAHRVTEVMAFYERNFAGQNRLTRLDGLVAHLTHQLEVWRTALQGCQAHDGAAVAAQLDAVEGHLELLAGELQEIERARAELDPASLEGVLAEVANGYFQLYMVHYAAKARVSRRAEVLSLTVAGLEWVSERLGGLAARGHDSETLGANRETVEARLEAYRSELGATHEAIAAVKPRNRVGALGADANDVMAMYAEHFAGQDRRTRDLSLLRELADRLYFTGLEMADLGDQLAGSQSGNITNLGIVRKTLKMYHEEYRNIRGLHQQPSSAGAASHSLDGMLRIRPDLDT